jgi:rhamnosyltransferase
MVFIALTTFDHDAIMEKESIMSVKVLNSNDKIVSVGASYGNIYKRVNSYIEKEYLITSGNLFDIKRANMVGGFCDFLFIDGVDFDFSFRMRDEDHKLVLSRFAMMKHQIGNFNSRKVFFFNIKFYDHSPIRYYYIYRNHIYILKKYYRKYTLFCIKKTLSSILLFLQIIVLEYDKLNKFRNILKGIHDGFGLEL